MNEMKIQKIFKDMQVAEENEEKANRILLKSAEKQYAAERLDSNLNQEFLNSRNKVINRKRAILSYSFPLFTEVYGQIKKIQFENDTRGIAELFDLKYQNQFSIDMGKLLSLEPLYLSEEQLMSSWIVTGIKGNIFTGGKPLDIGGLICWGTTGTIVKESEIDLVNSIAVRRQAEIYSEAINTKKNAIDLLCWHMDMISDIIAKMNLQFVKLINKSKQIITENGFTSDNYSDGDINCIGNTLNFAKAIKIIIDTPILDEKNELVEEAKSAIVMGKVIIAQCNNI